MCKKCKQPNKIEKEHSTCNKCRYAERKVRNAKGIDFEAEQRICEVCDLEKPKDHFIKHGLTCKSCRCRPKQNMHNLSTTRQCKTCLQRKDILIFFKNNKNDCDECYINKYITAKKPETSQEAKDLYNIVKDLKKQHRETPTEEVELKIKEAEKNCRTQYEVDHKEIRKLGVPRFCSCGGDFQFHSIKYHLDNYMKEHNEILEEFKNNNK